MTTANIQTTNRLHCRPRQVIAPTDFLAQQKAARRDNDEWERLLEEWGELNGLQYTLKSFSPERLAGHRPGRAGRCSADTRFPGCDHTSWFMKDGRPAAIVTEPYVSSEAVHDLPAYMAELGLVIHRPPIQKASLSYPGCTMFLVITKPDFGEVRWLREQLEFDGLTIHERASRAA